MDDILHVYIIDGIEQSELPIGIEYEVERVTVTLEHLMAESDRHNSYRTFFYRSMPVRVFRYYLVAV